MLLVAAVSLYPACYAVWLASTDANLLHLARAKFIGLQNFARMLDDDIFLAPVCVSWPAPPTGTEALFAEHGIPSFDEPDRGLRALGHLVRLGVARSRPRRPATFVPLAFDWPAHVSEGATVVSEDGCHAILRAAGLPAAAGALATSETAAQRIASELGLPVVLKGITPRITHRAAAGLLAVDLRTADDVAAGYRRLTERAAALSVTLDGVLV